MVPALRMLRTAHPESALELAGNLDHAAVLERYGVVERAFSSEDLRLFEGAAARARIAARWASAYVEGEHFDPRIGAECRRPAALELLVRLAAAAGWRGALDPTTALVAER